MQERRRFDERLGAFRRAMPEASLKGRDARFRQRTKRLRAKPSSKACYAARIAERPGFAKAAAIEAGLVSAADRAEDV